MGKNKVYAVYAASGVIHENGTKGIGPMVKVGISVSPSAAEAIEGSYKSFTRKTPSKDEQEPDYCHIEVVEFRDGLPSVMDSFVRDLIRQETLRAHNCEQAKISLNKFLSKASENMPFLARA